MTTSNPSNQSKQNSVNDIRRFSRMRPTVGIEIGSNSIYMVQLRGSSEGKLSFEKCKSFDFNPQLDLDTPAFATVLKNALKEFCGSSRGLSIWAAPKLDRARLHHIKIPRVKPSRLSGAVYWAVQKEERFLESETVVDFYVEESTDLGERTDLNITCALADREDIEAIEQAFANAGFSLTGIGLPLFALRNVVSLRGDVAPQSPALVCQLGQRATSVSVLHEQRLVFSRNIPLGIDSLADALVKELGPKQSKGDATKLILNLGSDKKKLSAEEKEEHERIFHLLLPILERLVRQFDRTIQYYQSNFNTDPIETIFLGGETAAKGYVFDFISGAHGRCQGKIHIWLHQ